jgi:hypothetical protein
MPPSPPTEPTPAALEERIRQVELRLIAREERLWRGVAEVKTRARDALQPRRLLKPLAVAGAVVLAGAAAWWLLRRSRQGRQMTQRLTVDRARWRSRVRAAVGLLTAVPWPPVVSWVWPLLPKPLKQRATPGGVATTLSVAMPWITQFASPKNGVGLLHLGLTSLTGLWAGILTRQQRAPRSPPAAQAGPG